MELIEHNLEKIVGGATFKIKEGSRRQVFNGTAEHTSGGLMKKDLMKNRHGEIVSKKASKAAKKTKNLKKFLQKKGSGVFGPKQTKRNKSGKKGKK
uniref:Uncharacterized protein n=1 Tax=viral metagenome TaxID=1070528 RepID=A0A6C0AUG1_9ZZZZ|tara:strand:+ start:419 stop:706 length:288 start_codon:yes stop_codon:yes gene_type:complete